MKMLTAMLLPPSNCTVEAVAPDVCYLLLALSLLESLRLVSVLIEAFCWTEKRVAPLQVFMAGVTDLGVDMVVSLPRTLQSRSMPTAQQ